MGTREEILALYEDDLTARGMGPVPVTRDISGFGQKAQTELAPRPFGGLSDLAAGLKRGAYRSPGVSQEGAGLLYNLGTGNTPAVQQRRAELAAAHPEMGGASIGDQIQAAGQGAIQRGESASGVPAPTTHLGRFGQGVGDQTMNLATGLAGSLGAGSAARIGADMALQGGATVASETAREGGGGAGAQLAAGILAPALIARGGASAKALATARMLSKKHGIPLKAVLEMADEAKLLVGNKRAVDRTVDRLQEPIFLDYPEDAQPTTLQFLGKRAGQNLAAREKELAREPTVAGNKFAAAVNNRREEAELELMKRAAAARPNRSAGRFDDIVETAIDDAAIDETKAWRLVDYDAMPAIPRKEKRSLFDAAVKSVREGVGGRFKITRNPDGTNTVELSGNLKTYVPKEALEIIEFGDTLTTQDLQRIRSAALRSRRGASVDSDAAQRSGNLKPLVKEMNRIIYELPDDIGSPEYRDALRLSRKISQLYSHDSAVVKSVVKGQRESRLVASIKSTEAEAERAMNIALTKGQEGVDSLRRTMWDDIFGREFGEKNPNQIRNALREYEAPLSKIYDPEQIAFMQQLARELEVVRTGDTGLAAATRVTGSNVLQRMYQRAKGTIAAVISPRNAFARAATRQIDETVRRNPDVDKLFREALLDRRLMVTVLRLPENAKELAKWRAGWKELTRRAARAAAEGEE